MEETTPGDAASKTVARVDRAAEWRSTLLWVVSALLLFETLTGLAIKYLPFSVPIQGMVIVHTLVGLVFLVPYAVYQLRHWKNYRRVQMTHFKMTGYLAMAATIVASVSGVVLTVQAAFLTRISYGWDVVHVVSTWALIAAALPHVFLIPLRDRKVGAARVAEVAPSRRRALVGVAALLVAVTLPTALFIGATWPEAWSNEFPAEYSWKYGEDRPFAPSLATTSSGGAYDPRSLSGSRKCGSSGCHAEILSGVVGQRPPLVGARSGVSGRSRPRWRSRTEPRVDPLLCAGCHDPYIALQRRRRRVFVKDG